MSLKQSSILGLLLLASFARAETPTMKIHVIDVGQGAATLVEFKCGVVLVDTGADETRHADSLITYLDKFFESRPDLNRTLDKVFLTHCHKDHTAGLTKLLDKYTIKRFIDNGIEKGSGWPDEKKFLLGLHDQSPSTKITRVTDSSIPSGALSNEEVDGLQCEDCDPKITVLSGGLATAPQGWKATEFNNLNNHSLTIRFELGNMSALIMGDMEVAGIERLVSRYRASGLLDIDVLFAGHHGARNGMTSELAQLESPKIGVIACGKHTDGDGENNPFTTYRYGHPNREAVQMIAAAVSTKRRSRQVWVGLEAKKFEPYKLTKGVYSTAWDGSFVLEAKPDGTIQVKKR